MVRREAFNVTNTRRLDGNTLAATSSSAGRAGTRRRGESQTPRLAPLVVRDGFIATCRSKPLS